MTCIHHWMINPPNGPVSKGVCCKCGDEKEFLNDVMGSATWWDLDEMNAQRRFEAQERKLRTDYALSAIPQKVNR